MTMNAPGLPVRTEYHAVDATSPGDDVPLSTETIKHAFYTNLFYVQGKIPTLATRHDYYLALALTVRDQMLHAGSARPRPIPSMARAPSRISPPSS